MRGHGSRLDVKDFFVFNNKLTAKLLENLPEFDPGMGK